MREKTKARQIDILDKRVFELAREMPDRMPEMFIALEEYDRTRKLPIYFTLDPTLYKTFKKYCERNGREVSKTLVSSMEKKLKAANI